MRDRQTCVGCGKRSPETETNYTLISAQFGWRLTRVKNADGAMLIEWRCPGCWQDFKRFRSPSSPDVTTIAQGDPTVLRPHLQRPPTPLELARRASSTPAPARQQPPSEPPTVKRPLPTDRLTPAPTTPPPRTPPTPLAPRPGARRPTR